MAQAQEVSSSANAWPALSTAALRVAFGIIWVVNAAFTWMPGISTNYAGYLHNAAEGQPAWSAWWFDAWIALVEPNPTLFLWLTRLATTALALALLLGFARRTVYVLGALYSLLIWSTAGGFGGPYTIGASNTGVSLLYVLIFAVLRCLDRARHRAQVRQRRFPHMAKKEQRQMQVSGLLRAPGIGCVSVRHALQRLAHRQRRQQREEQPSSHRRAPSAALPSVIHTRT